MKYKILSVIVSFVLSLSASVISTRLDDYPDKNLYLLANILWYSVFLLLFSTFVKIKIKYKRYISFLKKHAFELSLLAIITLTAAALRLIYLGSVPNVLGGDEGWTGMSALKLFPAGQTMYNHPFSSFEGFGRQQLNIIRFFITLFGRNKFALRLFFALGGILSVPAVYLLARYLFGKSVGLFSAFLVALSHIHIHFSRNAAVAYIHNNWLAPLEIYFFLSGLAKKSTARLVLSALFLSLHFHYYYGGKIIAGLLTVFLVISFFINKKLLKGNFTKIALFFLSFFILILPELFWSFNNPDDLKARWSKEGSFQSGWLYQKINNENLSAPLIFYNRFKHVIKSVFILPARSFYNAPAPPVHRPVSIMFFIGLFYSLAKISKTKYLFLNLWLWSIALSIAVFAIPASADSYRMLMALPPILILTALGWKLIIRLIRRIIRHRYVPVISTSLIIFLIAFVNLKTYFFDFIAGCRYLEGSLRGRGVSLIGDLLRGQSPFTKAYFLGSDEYQYGLHSSLDYLAGEVEIKNMLTPFRPVADRGNLIFIIIPSREPELELVKRFAPSGKTYRVFDCSRLSFIAYRTK